MNAPEDRDSTLSRFREGPALLEQTLMGLRDSELDFKPSGGGWSVRQIVHHIVDGDDIWKLGIKMAVGGDQAEFSLGWYSSQTQDTWANRWAYDRRSIDTSLSLLKVMRDHVLQLVESVPEAWHRAVVVRTRGGECEQVSVGFVIQMQADHLVHHVERIRAIVHEARGLHNEGGTPTD